MQMFVTDMNRFREPDDQEGECACCSDCDGWLDDEMYEDGGDLLCVDCLKDRFRYSA